MIFEMKIQIPGLPRRTNNNSRTPWYMQAKEAKKWKSLVVFYASKYRPDTPLNRAKLTLTRHSSRSPDFDGLVSSFKHVIDGLVSVGIIKDDSMDIIGQPNYKWEKTARRQGFITVEVTTSEE